MSGSEDGPFKDSTKTATYFPISRSHEKVIFLLYSSLGCAGVAFCQQHIIPPIFLDMAVVFVWLGHILAISFLETWIISKAPLLRMHIALDFKRLMIGALQAVELSMAGVMCFSRLILRRNEVIDFLPINIAMTCLAISGFMISPRLSRLAEFQIVDALRHDNNLTDKEEANLKKMSREIQDRPRPIKIWLRIYYVLEILKAVMLIYFLLGLVHSGPTPESEYSTQL